MPSITSVGSHEDFDYSQEAFKSFVNGNNIDVQSSKWIEELARIWETVYNYLQTIQKEKLVNIVGLVNNYSKWSYADRLDIVQWLKEKLWEFLVNEDYDEAILIGLGMMFDDVLEDSDAGSLVHMFNRKIQQTMNKATSESDSL